ncbi:unnamed protein product [Bursaphelenchus okinawaensis]|uniref:Uncharacterized protein n=1 Tax=Bursaphelenchus okinawaensis TaxID=465554 RepID=A0A811LD00_9BILA|nr:unnamed protein product [Bursaphelenchus okinawaensis]CAG9120901.1 unnamed protein product [Bursaphelenchus okinawaensis]
MSTYSMSSQHFVPSPDVMMTIVFPTIIFCIGMVVAMLIGINRCKQWELDKIVEMRRTRRVIQRITARLREKNFRTIQKARHIRKRAVASVNSETTVNRNFKGSPAPPVYSDRSVQYSPGNSPPPAYDDVLDDLYYECMPPNAKTKNKEHWK